MDNQAPLLVNRSPRRRIVGFTLIELVISIVILGIMGGMVAVFLRQPVDAYLSTAARGALTESADGAIRRLSRDFQAALPNSFNSPNNQCIQFLPVVAGGRYRVERDSTNDANDNVLDFTVADNVFDVLAHNDLIPLQGTNHVVIFNLGIPGADAYATPAQNRAQILNVAANPVGGAAARITLNPAFQFPFASPGRRFQVIPNFSVVYSCAAGQIRRSTPLLANGRIAACPAGGELLVADVDCAQSSFNFAPASAVRDGVVEVILTLVSSALQGETVRLYDRVGVSNAP